MTDEAMKPSKERAQEIYDDNCWPDDEEKFVKAIAEALDQHARGAIQKERAIAIKALKRWSGMALEYPPEVILEAERIGIDSADSDNASKMAEIADGKGKV